MLCIPKNNLFSFSLCFISSFCIAQTTFIPDDKFEQALINLGYDSGPLDDFVPTVNIADIDKLDVSSNAISDLTGIQDFVGLTVLDCSDNNLSDLELSTNVNLIELYCNNNSLTSLNTSDLFGLQKLWCSFNKITALNLINNISLSSVYCGDNLISSLDVTVSTNLGVLSCENNLISVIDVTQNKLLNSLIVRGNFLTGLDVTQNTTLAFLDCGINQISNLDVSQNSNLRVLLCFNNQLTSLDVTQNILLTDLSCEFNQITVLDMSKNTSLLNLDCSHNDLCLLNIKNGTNDNAPIMDFEFNPNLSCVIVDDASISYPNWRPFPFSNFANELSECTNFIPVDTLPDFTGISFTLPVLDNGDYFTQSGGNGVQLQPEDKITTSQIIYIYNKNNCFSNETRFTVTILEEVYDVPKYFTPNNDGTNDYWNVVDNTNGIDYITIHDRYGKLLKYLLPDAQGWDGQFNSKPLPMDSYWYKITLKNKDVITGYFVLKR